MIFSSRTPRPSRSPTKGTGCPDLQRCARAWFGTFTGIEPSPIQRKLTIRLGSMGQRCPPVSREGDGQRGMLVSDSHYCRAVITSNLRFHLSPIQIAPHGKQGANTVGMGLSIISSTGEL
ncbi:hypothetical protein PoB_002027000 [Plakobranchus ocellatus]|uniref:Uncharacterized protein n=1 Tax=Plakobranchus ocellatus TaxID=259542 RepID=A0AAV3ZF48_9GAST|nr:hypothetical protein PoB_002027000 [Plakobranchus ocellatus]